MKKILYSLIISITLACLLIISASSPVILSIEHKLYDLRMVLRPPIAQDEHIVYVEMDEEAIENLGRWPWPRETFAYIIDTLNDLGARQILFDITFTQESPLNIDKKTLGQVLAGKDQINDFIRSVSEDINASEALNKTDIISDLDQINNGINELSDAANKKLNYALRDNDKILSSAFKGKNTYVGFTFEVLHELKDIHRDNDYPKIRSLINDILKKGLDISYKDLPAFILQNPYFTTQEKKEILLRCKIGSLLRDDIQISPDKISQKLNLDINKILPSFIEARQETIKTDIGSFLEKNADAEFKGLMWEKEITDQTIINLYKNAWEEIQKEKVSEDLFGMDKNTDQEVYKAVRFYAPITDFAQTVKGSGFLNGIPDEDGVLRSVPLFVEYNGKIFPHISIASIMDLLHTDKIDFIKNKFLILKDAKINNAIADIFIPIDKNATMIINWAGRWKDTFKHISCADIYRLYYLKERLKENDPLSKDELVRLNKKESDLKEKIKNSICIVGLTAPGTHDYNPVPYESAYPMVGTHGNIINSILNQQFIIKLDEKYNRIILLLLAILIGLIIANLSPMLGLLITFVMSFLVLGLSQYLFQKGIWTNLADPLLLLTGSYIGITTYKFSTEEKEKRWVKKAFSQYVSPDVIKEIMHDPSKLKLGGQRKTLSVLFSDIRGFTTYSEKRNPEEIVSILNEYLDEMTKIIFANKGTLDKYVGDEIMAVFGAPHYEPPEESAKKAVITGCQMLARLKELQDKWVKEGKEPMDIGIGVNTGEMVVGNMGSALRMDYTVIGDAVNLGARIEALTRNYNTHFIISESTYQYVKDIIEAKQLEAIKVKGKEIPVMTYEVIKLKS